MSRAFITNIEQDTLENEAYRRVIYTGPLQQLVLMSLAPREEIGMEIHDDVDQFIRVEQGVALAMTKSPAEVLRYSKVLRNGDIIMIPQGTWHNIINHGNIPLKLYTIYSPAQHPPETLEWHKH